MYLSEIRSIPIVLQQSPTKPPNESKFFSLVLFPLFVFFFLSSHGPFWNEKKKKKEEKQQMEKEWKEKLRAQGVLWKGFVRVIKIRGNLLIRSRLPFLLPYSHKFPSHEIAICCQLNWICVVEVTFRKNFHSASQLDSREICDSLCVEFLVFVFFFSKMKSTFHCNQGKPGITCWKHVLYTSSIHIDILKW